jgi:phosphinothricin acetyltransferase
MRRGVPGDGPRIRDAQPADLTAIQAIYAHHVRHGLASFDISGRGLPYLAGELDGAVRGYAYANSYRPRPAYRFTAENSVYVAPGFEGRGLGRALLEATISRCEGLGLRRLVAVIGDSANLASIRLHERAGFHHSGRIPRRTAPASVPTGLITSEKWPGRQTGAVGTEFA